MSGVAWAARRAWTILGGHFGARRTAASGRLRSKDRESLVMFDQNTWSARRDIAKTVDYQGSCSKHDAGHSHNSTVWRKGLQLKWRQIFGTTSEIEIWYFHQIFRPVPVPGNNLNSSTSTTVFPTGNSVASANFTCAQAKGMPMMVMAWAAAAVMRIMADALLEKNLSGSSHRLGGRRELAKQQ